MVVGNQSSTLDIWFEKSWECIPAVRHLPCCCFWCNMLSSELQMARSSIIPGLIPYPMQLSCLMSLNNSWNYVVILLIHLSYSSKYKFHVSSHLLVTFTALVLWTVSGHSGCSVWMFWMNIKVKMMPSRQLNVWVREEER